MTTQTWEARWNEIVDAAGGGITPERMRVLSAEDNANDTMMERHGRIPGTMSDPMWEEWSEVAFNSYQFLSDVEA